jgi:hypothetical protein
MFFCFYKKKKCKWNSIISERWNNKPSLCKYFFSSMLKGQSSDRIGNDGETSEHCALGWRVVELFSCCHVQLQFCFLPKLSIALSSNFPFDPIWRSNTKKLIFPYHDAQSDSDKQKFNLQTRKQHYHLVDLPPHRSKCSRRHIITSVCRWKVCGGEMAGKKSKLL